MKKLSESLWSDLQNKSIGKSIRREDNVDNLDFDGLVEYLRNNYKCEQYTIVAVKEYNSITISLYEDEDGYNVFLIYGDVDTNPVVEISSTFKESAEWIYKDMESRYTLHTREDFDQDGHPYSITKVEPKGCRYIKLTNKFLLEVLDFIIERIHEPLTKTIEKK